MKEQRTIQGNKMKAWEYDTNTWNIATDDDGLVEVVASAVLNTTRQRRMDYSGEKAYRVNVRTEVTLTVRIGYKMEVVLGDQILFYDGTVGAMRKLFEYVQSGMAMKSAQFELESRAHKAGLSDYQIMDALYDWRNTDENQTEQTCRRLYRAIEKHQEYQAA